MFLASHLKKSQHGVFYFRVAVPAPLRAVFGVSEIKKTLRTKDPATARRLAYTITAQTFAEFGRARKMVRRYKPENFNPNDAATWGLDDDGRDLRPLQIRRPDGTVLDFDPSKPGEMEAAERLTRILAETPPPASTVDTGATQALKEVAAAISAQIPERDPDDEQNDTRPLSEGVRLFLDEYKGSVKPHTFNEASGLLENFKDWVKKHGGIGNDPPLVKIRKTTVDRWKTWQLKEAPNVRKIAAAKRARKAAKNAAERAAVVVETGKDKDTVSKNISTLARMFRNLQRRGLYPETRKPPTDDIPLFSFREKTASDFAGRYQPFDDEDLARLFALKNLKPLKSPHEFFCPLIGLYTAARIGEIAQLRQKDIKRHGEHWSITFTTEVAHGVVGELPTSQKNIGPRTRIIHPDLIAVGLIDYLNDAAAVVPGGRLFPYLREDNGRFADVPSEWFGRYRNAVGVSHPKKVFHSFRSTLSASLGKVPVSATPAEKAARVSPELIDRYVGWAVEGTRPRHYPDDMTPEDFHAEIGTRIRFPVVAALIPALRYTPGHYLPALRNEVDKRQRHEKRKARLKGAAAEAAKRAVRT